jgi:hypothetical protein
MKDMKSMKLKNRFLSFFMPFMSFMVSLFVNTVSYKVCDVDSTPETIYNMNREGKWKSWYV